MKLAILHYHLNRGGVARVVENHLAALDAVLDRADPWQVAVVHGGRRQGWNEPLAGRFRAIHVSFCELPALDYDEVHGLAPADCLRAIQSELPARLERLGFAPDETVLHFHNHSLGKNRAAAPLLAWLAERGYALLLQVHDFAEDFRPRNYRRLAGLPPGGCYPQSPSVHYAVLNDRDYRILGEAGVEEDRLHLLPNPVPSLGPLPARSAARSRMRETFGVDESARLLLYPVRCIRRKNVGEALLYALLGPPGTVVALTLPPLNPAERSFYERWKRAAAELDVPCRFETGSAGALTFLENLAASDAILSTSVAEGFGMAFLEAWLAGRPLLGRDLPEITGDFVRAGVRFDRLRARLDVPIELVGMDRYLDTASEAYRRTAAAYGRPVPLDLRERLSGKIEAGRIDFGDLDEPMQRDVLDATRSDAALRRRILDANAGLEAALDATAEEAAERIGENVRAIKAAFSRAPSGRRLVEVYRRVAASPRGEPVEPLPCAQRILANFLSPERFRLLRSL
jgi:hypothetical protein